VRSHLLLALALTAVGAPAMAAEPVDGCVDISDRHQAFRFGSQYLLVADDDAHYRLGFRDCGDLSISTRFAFSSDGTDNRICSADTRVKLNRSTCTATSLERIDAATFERLRRRR